MRSLKFTIFAALTFCFISCSSNASEIAEDNQTSTSEELQSSTLATAIDDVIINYPITAINDDSSTEEVNSDEEFRSFFTRNTRPNITFPFDITVDGETISIESYEDLRMLLKRPKHKRLPFKLVFPVTVVNEDGTTTEIADIEAMKAYRKTLEEGVKPTFEFPISVEDKEGNITEIESEEDFEAYVRQAIENRKNYDRPKLKRPPFK